MPTHCHSIFKTNPIRWKQLIYFIRSLFEKELCIISNSIKQEKKGPLLSEQFHEGGCLPLPFCTAQELWP